MFLQIIFELFHGHQNFSRLGSFLRSYDTGIRELVHDSGRAVETDFQHSLEHADRCLIFFDDKFSGFHEVIIAVISAAYPEDETILVQGIIDAWFPEGDEIVLVDYKTDRVKEVGELKKRYEKQLAYYQQALERTTGKKVKEKIIYSLALDEELVL